MSLLISVGWIASLTVAVALLATINARLHHSLGSLVQLTPPQAETDPDRLSELTVIVPAYNEAANVVACLSSILDSTPAPIQVWLVDDVSTDTTWELAEALAAERGDPRLRLWKGQPRPIDQIWAGKNWACAQVASQFTREYVLFIDCDVRLRPGALEAALETAKRTQADLLTVGPDIVCGCLAEWVVQPIMVVLLAVGYDFATVNHADGSAAFAFGPFMLFRRPAYQSIGGHAAIADQIVEDVQLARRIRQSGSRLILCMSGGLVTTRMYQDAQSLWEGWSKNWFLGLGESWFLALLSALGLIWVGSLPWLGLVVGMGMAIRELPPWEWVLLLSGLGIGGQVGLRWQLQHWMRLPMHYTWLTGLAGLWTAAIALSSAYKTSTGRGWTWRGRILHKPGQSTSTS